MGLSERLLQDHTAAERAVKGTARLNELVLTCMAMTLRRTTVEVKIWRRSAYF